MTKKKKVEEKKTLTEAEMLKLEVVEKDMRITELEIIAITAKKKVMDLEFYKELELKKEKHKNLTDRKAKYSEVLAKKYELKEGLKGFDPLTGEIINE